MASWSKRTERWRELSDPMKTVVDGGGFRELGKRVDGTTVGTREERHVVLRGI